MWLPTRNQKRRFTNYSGSVSGALLVYHRDGTELLQPRGRLEVNARSYLIIVIASICYGAPSIADPGSSGIAFHARCDAPKGKTISFGKAFALDGSPFQTTEEGFIPDDDGFSNMHPSFFMNADNDKILYSVWGDTLPDELKNLPENLRKYVSQDAKLEENQVVFLSESEIVAIMRSGNETWLTTLFPKRGVAYFSKQEKNDNIYDGWMTSAAVYAAKCEFTFMPPKNIEIAE